MLDAAHSEKTNPLEPAFLRVGILDGVLGLWNTNGDAGRGDREDRVVLARDIALLLCPPGEEPAAEREEEVEQEEGEARPMSKGDADVGLGRCCCGGERKAMSLLFGVPPAPMRAGGISGERSKDESAKLPPADAVLSELPRTVVDRLFCAAVPLLLLLLLPKSREPKLLDEAPAAPPTPPRATPSPIPLPNAPPTNTRRGLSPGIGMGGAAEAPSCPKPPPKLPPLPPALPKKFPPKRAGGAAEKGAPTKDVGGSNDDAPLPASLSVPLALPVLPLTLLLLFGG